MEQLIFRELNESVPMAELILAWRYEWKYKQSKQWGKNKISVTLWTLSNFHLNEFHT